MTGRNHHSVGMGGITEIAQQLTITTSTTKHHVSAILSKLGASSRAAAVVLAMEQGLIGESTAE